MVLTIRSHFGSRLHVPGDPLAVELSAETVQQMVGAMPQLPQPAPSTPLSPRPPPPPMSPRPPPPTSPPPAKSLHTYGLIFEYLVDPSTRLDRSRLPSHRHYKPTAVPQSKPQSGSGDAPELASGNFQEPEPELVVGEGQLVLTTTRVATSFATADCRWPFRSVSECGTACEGTSSCTGTQTK